MSSGIEHPMVGFLSSGGGSVIVETPLSRASKHVDASKWKPDYHVSWYTIILWQKGNWTEKLMTQREEHGEKRIQ